jgi:hypothetical protein
MPKPMIVGEIHPAAQPLRERLGRSPVIGWLKDLDGRYVYANDNYAEALGAPAERILGHTDAELAPREAIDGPRIRERETIEDEPIQLEYRVAAFEGRPALAVMRFPVRDVAGAPVGGCGVAAPIGDAQLVRSECGELMKLHAAGCAAATDADGQAQERSRIAAFHDSSAAAARRAHELLAELAAERETSVQLRRELDAVSARLMEIEHQRPVARATEQELDRERHRAREAEDRADRERERADRAQADAEREQQRAERAEAETGREHARLIQAEAQARAAAERERQPAAPAPTSGRPRWSSAAQFNLATALAGAAEWRIGMRDVVKELGREAGWDAVCAWLPDDLGRFLRCGAMWTAASYDQDEFETRTWQKPYPIMHGALGRAFASTETTWLAGLAEAVDDRLQAVARQGMRSSVLVPVRSGSVGIALLELLSSEKLDRDAELDAAMGAIALQLGHFSELLRLGDQPRWRLGRL